MSLRVFTVNLSEDEIQPVEVPNHTNFLGITPVFKGGGTLHALGDFSDGSCTRFICRTTLRKELPTQAVKFIDKVISPERGLEYFFELMDDSAIPKQN